MKRFLAILAVMLALPYSVQAQTEVELSGVFGRPSLVDDQIGFKFSGSMLTKVDRLRMGFNYADGIESSPFYGPVVALSLRTWNISADPVPKTIELEMLGFTDISGGFDFDNGALGVGAILDLWPGNGIKQVTRVLWSDDADMGQAWLVVVGARIGVE